MFCPFIRFIVEFFEYFQTIFLFCKEMITHHLFTFRFIGCYHVLWNDNIVAYGDVLVRETDAGHCIDLARWEMVRQHYFHVCVYSCCFCSLFAVDIVLTVLCCLIGTLDTLQRVMGAWSGGHLVPSDGLRGVSGVGGGGPQRGQGDEYILSTVVLAC